MSNIPTTRNKDKCKIKNWKTYNQSLCRRGSLTMWLEDSVLKEWEDVSKKQKEIGEQTYSDSIIQCCLFVEDQLWYALASKYGFYAQFVYADGQKSFSRTRLYYAFPASDEPTCRHR
jgi:hypothetical protein